MVLGQRACHCFNQLLNFKNKTAEEEKIYLLYKVCKYIELHIYFPFYSGLISLFGNIWVAAG